MIRSRGGFDARDSIALVPGMDDLKKRFAWLRRQSMDSMTGADDGATRLNGHSIAAPIDTPDIVGALVREGDAIRLRAHVPANRAAFQRWYADDEIATLLRHDQRPLNEAQSRAYFDTIILPMSAQGLCWAIHQSSDDRLIGTTALTDLEGYSYRTSFYRIVIGEKEFWGQGYGTAATLLVMQEAFWRQALDEVKLEVFRHNTRAFRAYERVGFVQTGEHVEWVGRERFELHVTEMSLLRSEFVGRWGERELEMTPAE